MPRTVHESVSAMRSHLVTPSRREERPGRFPVENSSLPSRWSMPTSAGSMKGTARLSPNEVRRRLWHMLPGLLPFLIPDLRGVDGPVHWLALCVIAGVVLGLSALAYRVFDTISREGEREHDRVLTALTYGVVPLLMLLCFPSQPQLAALVLVVLAFGDGLATLFGMRWGRTRLPWNAVKTRVGSAAFLLCSAPAATLAYWWWATPTVSFGIAAWCGGTTALLSMLVESNSSGKSDNLAVSGTAAAAVLACHSILFGWPG